MPDSSFGACPRRAKEEVMSKQMLKIAVSSVVLIGIFARAGAAHPITAATAFQGCDEPYGCIKYEPWPPRPTQQ